MQFRELLNALRPNKQMVIKASSLMAVVILCGLAGFAVRQTLKISPFSNSVVAYAGTSQTTEVTTAQSSAESTVQTLHRPLPGHRCHRALPNLLL